MATFYLSSANWTEQLVTAIRDAQDGDVIRVDSDTKSDCVKRALKRMAPDKQVSFVVVQEK